jgi:nucleotide-binding universal stress UspA family protein
MDVTSRPCAEKDRGGVMVSTRPAPVVIGVDGTPGSQGALRYGIIEARRLGVGVRLVHVVPSFVPVASLMPLTPQELTHIGSRILGDSEAQAREVAPGMEIEAWLRQGARSVELSRAAHDATMLVVGRTERTAVETLFAGDTGTGAAARASVPTVSVPGTWEPGKLRAVLVGIKTRVDSEPLLAHAFALASADGARVRALHAWRLSSEYDDVIADRTRAEEWTQRSLDDMESLLRPWRESFPDTPVETRAVHGYPAHALVAASRDADALVLVRRPRDIPALRHIGGTGRVVLHAAACPVHVVPPEGAGHLMPVPPRREPAATT